MLVVRVSAWTLTWLEGERVVSCNKADCMPCSLSLVDREAIYTIKSPQCSPNLINFFDLKSD